MTVPFLRPILALTGLAPTCLVLACLAAIAGHPAAAWTLWEAEPPGTALEQHLDRLIEGGEDLTELHDRIEDSRERSGFRLLGRSTKGLERDVDALVLEIEKALLQDGNVGAIEEIRRLRAEIAGLGREIEVLRRDLYLARQAAAPDPDETDRIEGRIARREAEMAALEGEVAARKQALQQSFAEAGAALGPEEIDSLTSRADGDDLLRMFAVFDITRKITDELKALMAETSPSPAMQIQYYGVFVVMAELQVMVHREYMRRLDEEYLPALETIKGEIDATVAFARERMTTATPEQQDIYAKNIAANALSLDVIARYERILDRQKARSAEAMEKARSWLDVTYSTYDTAVNSMNVLNFIDETDRLFGEIMTRQLPDLEPFDDTVLRQRFEEISDRVAEIVGNS
ncbi:hypothetical protein [Rhodovulum sulfidophilum]|uniref:hypothetical protein n=1 Tax=Rhodovulum sulfidophilum TaxID=35806 RepID=UPI001F2BC1C5|nr:hypothetical protein [Rhodovulum sulfidophilum]MCE8439671.1 hypothetical protein [Rhodovulum sulfidophilum]MCE8468374.1 hypothetical protein [Rhodovulum sulfidophilum]